MVQDRNLQPAKTESKKKKKRENLNRPRANKVIESVINNSPTKKTPEPDGFIGEFYPTF